MIFKEQDVRMLYALSHYLSSKDDSPRCAADLQGLAGRISQSLQTGPAAASELTHNATRLRNVARLVGLEKAIPEDDAQLDEARGAVLGMVAYQLRRGVQYRPDVQTALHEVYKAVRRLVEGKGRYHTEHNYKALEVVYKTSKPIIEKENVCS